MKKQIKTKQLRTKHPTSPAIAQPRTADSGPHGPGVPAAVLYAALGTGTAGPLVQQAAGTVQPGVPLGVLAAREAQLATGDTGVRLGPAGGREGVRGREGGERERAGGGERRWNSTFNCKAVRQNANTAQLSTNKATKKI